MRSPIHIIPRTKNHAGVIKLLGMTRNYRGEMKNVSGFRLSKAP